MIVLLIIDIIIKTPLFSDEVIELVVNRERSLKKKSKTNMCHEPLLTININVAPTNTSLNKPVEKARAKLSTIKEIKDLEENAMNSVKTKLKKTKTLKNNSSTLVESKDNIEEESTKLVRNLQNTVNDFNNTIDDMKPKPPEIVLSPFVCTTRGQKWKPSPRKPPKLSELFIKYEDDNIADTYRCALRTIKNIYFILHTIYLYFIIILRFFSSFMLFINLY